jgi:uncharacterized membrane protein YfcA
MDPWLLLGLFIFVSFTTEAMTGFGSIVIAVSLGALVLPIDAMLPVLVPLNVCMSGYLSVKNRAKIHWPTLTRLILPAMVVGTLAGHYLRPHVSTVLLKSLFGVLILWFAARELWRLRGAVVSPSSPRSPAAARALMLSAGMTHGLFASGGPLLVYALAGNALKKEALRATLILVWFALNGLLTLVFIMDGSAIAAAPRVLMYLPVVAVGIVLGERLHHKINERQFRRALFGVLAIVGLMLAIPRTPKATSPSTPASSQGR